MYKALLDTASGLDYLHSIGVVHGDLKTCNVLLKGSARDARGFSCKIADFGLSRVLEMDATHISTRTYGEQQHQSGHAVPAAQAPVGVFMAGQQYVLLLWLHHRHALLLHL